MMQRVPMCGRFADYGVYHTLLVPNDVAAAKGASSISSDAPIQYTAPDRSPLSAVAACTPCKQVSPADCK